MEFVRDVVDPGSFHRERLVEVAVASPVHAICKPRRIGNRSHARTRRVKFYDRESPPIRRVALIRGFFEVDSRENLRFSLLRTKLLGVTLVSVGRTFAIVSI